MGRKPIDVKATIEHSVAVLKEQREAHVNAGHPITPEYVNELLHTSAGTELTEAVLRLDDIIAFSAIRPGDHQVTTQLIAGKTLHERLIALLSKPDLNPQKSYNWLCTGIRRGITDAARGAYREKRSHESLDQHLEQQTEGGMRIKKSFSARIDQERDHLGLEETEEEHKADIVLEQVLVEAIKHLNPTRQQLMRVWLEYLAKGIDPLYESLATTLNVPIGTVKSGLTGVHHQIEKAARLIVSDNSPATPEDHIVGEFIDLLMAKRHSFNIFPLLDAVDHTLDPAMVQDLKQKMGEFTATHNHSRKIRAFDLHHGKGLF